MPTNSKVILPAWAIACGFAGLSAASLGVAGYAFYKIYKGVMNREVKLEWEAISPPEQMKSEAQLSVESIRVTPADHEEIIDKDSVNIQEILHNRKMHSRLISVPTDIVGAVLGRHARNIRGLEEETNTLMEYVRFTETDLRYGKHNGTLRKPDDAVDDEDWIDNPAVEAKSEALDETEGADFHHFIQIFASTQEKLRLASLAVEALIKEHSEAYCKVIFRIPAYTVGYIIGHGGRNIKKVKDTFKVKIMIDQDPTAEFSGVTVAGYDEFRVRSAKESIQNSVARAERMRYERELRRGRADDWQELEQTTTSNALAPMTPLTAAHGSFNAASTPVSMVNSTLASDNTPTSKVISSPATPALIRTNSIRNRGDSHEIDVDKEMAFMKMLQNQFEVEEHGDWFADEVRLESAQGVGKFREDKDNIENANSRKLEMKNVDDSGCIGSSVYD